MIVNLKNKFSMLLKSEVAQNGVWLYILQIFNTVIPLITLPYITRILGPSQYGVFSSSLNLVGYFQVFVEYGFNLSGARKVALSNNKDEISSIYSRITISRLFLCLSTFIILVVMGVLLNVNKIQFQCMLILYTMVIGTAIQQTWLFQGMQVMKYITVISVISRTISVILIFLFVKNADQVYLYCGLYALTFFLMGVISTQIIRFKYNIYLVRVTSKDIINELKEGWCLFTTSAMTKIFSGIGITMLTFTTQNEIVGIYSAIQKIPLMIIMIYYPIGQVIYPYVSKFYLSSYQEGIRAIKKIFKYILSIFTSIGILIIISSRLIIGILYGVDYSVYSLVLVPLIFWMLLSIINNLLGIQVLVASGHIKEYSVAFRLGVMAIIIFNITLGRCGMFGVAFASMMSELSLTVAIVCQMKKIKILNK